MRDGKAKLTVNSSFYSLFARLSLPISTPSNVELPDRRHRE
jgi:hypothetical protein